MRRVILLTWAVVALSLAGANIAAADFSVTDFHLSSQPDGPAMTAFPAGTTEVYAVFNYTDAKSMPIQVKLYDPLGQVLFLQTEKYQGDGTEVLRITNGGYPFNEGVYLLNMYTGMAAPQTGTDDSLSRLYIFQTIEWTMGEATIPEAGSGEVIATVVVPGAGGGQAVAGAGGGTSPALLAAMAGVLILLVGIVGWAVRRLLTASQGKDFDDDA